MCGEGRVVRGGGVILILRILTHKLSTVAFLLGRNFRLVNIQRQDRNNMHILSSSLKNMCVKCDYVNIWFVHQF